MDKADQRDFDSHYEYWDKIKKPTGGEMRKITDVTFPDKTIAVQKETHCDAELVIRFEGKRVASIYLNRGELLLLQNDIVELLYSLTN